MSSEDNHKIFVKLVPQLVDLLSPIFKAMLNQDVMPANPENPTPGEVGTLTGHVLSSINLDKLEKMVRSAETKD